MRSEACCDYDDPAGANACFSSHYTPAFAVNDGGGMVKCSTDGGKKR
ncbi:MAG: hypothetical protein OXU66_00395 [Gammaproteobacteria bacterium]|nr:hypothetical protein [Gammaproteobacteria bacterium]MDD9894698.1 hypothetical protein [Gammaproteobacteria bacterium]MDD9957372.1 hypothetical protein [Gammaproteobacteria bacterium]